MFHYPAIGWCSAVVAGCCFSLVNLSAQSPPESSTHFQRQLVDKPDDSREALLQDHLRLDLDIDQQPIALQTSITRLEPATDDKQLVVDLISVVHIADREYYAALNRMFDRYDVVLYELVAPPERQVPDERQGANSPIRMFQRLAQSVLDLSHQMDQIDYRRENFVHADLSPQQMVEAIQKRGDDQFTLLLEITADLIRAQNRRAQESIDAPQKARQPLQPSPIELMVDPYGAVKLKRLLARQFVSISGRGMGLGRTIDRVFIEDRNEAAIKVFQQELVKERQRIGIFYGAAHMPDFEQRLTRDFGLQRTDVKWLTAWDLRMIPKSPVEGVIGQFVDELLRIGVTDS